VEGSGGTTSTRSSVGFGKPASSSETRIASSTSSVESGTSLLSPGSGERISASRTGVFSGVDCLLRGFRNETLISPRRIAPRLPYPRRSHEVR
jgi:hypothetical protein